MHVMVPPVLAAMKKEHSYDKLITSVLFRIIRIVTTIELGLRHIQNKARKMAAVIFKVIFKVI
jgi:hypothetical protein